MIPVDEGHFENSSLGTSEASAVSLGVDLTRGSHAEPLMRSFLRVPADVALELPLQDAQGLEQEQSPGELVLQP
jgi:hypothetical protein